MTILIISYDFRPNLGGVGTCAYELACSLSKNHKVIVLAKAQAGDREFDELSPFKTIRLSLGERAIFSIPSILRAVRNIVKEEKVEKVISMLWMPSGLAVALGMWLKIIPRTPLYTFAHGVEIFESKYSLKKRLRSLLSPLKNFTFRFSTKAFCVSQYTGQLLKDISSLPQERVAVVYNGVNPQVFYKKEPSSRLKNLYKVGNKKVCLTITRLEDYKGVDSMIYAMRELDDVVYLIGGSGPDKDRLQRLVSELSLEDRVIFCGRIPDSELIDYYNLADCNVLLSRFDEKTPNFEGFGLVFLEAAACGTPSLGGNTGGIPDAVINNKTGFLVNPHDTREVVAKAKELLFGEETHQKMVEECLDFSKNKMTWDHMSSRISEAW